ncbi:MAG: hypothetical protein MZV63_24305 [Marinilabiliales bacterium]|nr:hypothetical protein [Marinilabiliales bacterium]
MKGGVTWSWKWGWIGLIKDNFIWGNNYNGANIFDGKNPYFHTAAAEYQTGKMVRAQLPSRMA